MADIDIGTLTATVKMDDQLTAGLGEATKSLSEFDRVAAEVGRKLPTVFSQTETRIRDLVTEQLKLADGAKAAARALSDLGGISKVTADQAAALFKEIQAGSEAFKTIGTEVPEYVQHADDSLKTFLETSGRLKKEGGEAPEELKNKWHEAGESLNGVFEHVTEGIGELAQKFINFKGIAATLATGGLLVGIAEIGEQFEDSSHKIEQATGRTGEELEALNKSVENVLPNVSSSLKEVTGAVAELAQRTDLAGQPLEDMTSLLLDLAQITGTQVNTLVRDSTRAFESWNIATDDQAEALEFLYKASTHSGAGVGQLLNEVTRIGAPLRELGFSFKDSVALFAQFEKAGIETSKAVQALRTALGQFAKAGQEPKKALEELIEKIRKTDDEQLALSMGMKAFGSRGGADMVSAIRNGKLNVEEFTKSLEDSKSTIKGVADDTEGLAGKFQKLENAALIAAKPIGEFLVKRLEDLLEKTVELTPKLVGLIQSVTDLGEAAKKTGEGGEEGASGLSEFAANITTVGIAAGGLSLGIRGVTFVFKPLFDGVTGLLTKLGFEGGLGSVFKALATETGLLTGFILALEIPIYKVGKATEEATDKFEQGLIDHERSWAEMWDLFGKAVVHNVAVATNPLLLIEEILRKGDETIRRFTAGWELFWIQARRGDRILPKLSPNQEQALINQGAAKPNAEPASIFPNTDVTGHWEDFNTAQRKFVDEHIVDLNLLTTNSKEYDDVLKQLDTDSKAWNESLKEAAKDSQGALERAREELDRFIKTDEKFPAFKAEIESGVFTTKQLTAEFGLGALAISLYKKDIQEGKKSLAELTREQKDAEKALTSLNAEQRKSLDQLEKWGVVTDEVVAHSLEPLINQLNEAAKAQDALNAATKQYVAPGAPTTGMLEQGNIDILHQARHVNEDGSTSTVATISVNIEGREVLLDTIDDMGKVLTEAEAIAKFSEDHKHLGIFDTPENANAYVKALDLQQEAMIAAEDAGTALTQSTKLYDQTLLEILPKLWARRDAEIAVGKATSDVDQIIEGYLARTNNLSGVFGELERRMVTAKGAAIPLGEAIGKITKYEDPLIKQTERMGDAFHEMGIKTQYELSQAARRAEQNFKIISTTAGVAKEDVKKAWEEMTKAQLAEQHKVPNAWVTEIYPVIKRTAEQIKSAVMGEFDSMLLGATSFKDGMLKIWDDIKAGIMRILTEILSDFAGRFLKGLLGAMSGQQGAFQKAFSGLFGGGSGIPGMPGGGGGSWLQKLLGVGGGAAGPGFEAGIAQTPIWAGGLGTAVPGFGAAVPAYGAPGFVAGGGAPAAGAGAGIGATIAGGAVAGGAGFGLGVLGQNFFGRGAGAATFGGASGAGAGALIGTMIFPGVGTAIGALIGGLGGVLGGLINFGPSKKEKQSREQVATFQQNTFAQLTPEQMQEARTSGWSDPSAAGTLIAVRDAYLAIGKTSQQAEEDVKKMWDAEKKGPEATANALFPLMDALDEYRKKQEEATTAVNKYSNELDDQGQKLIEAGKLFEQTGKGGDDLKQQTDAFNELLQTATETGDALPMKLQPILEKLLELGLLTDKDGKKLENLDSITFTNLTGAAAEAANKIHEKYKAMKDDIAKEFKSLDDELAAINKSEAPEEHMGTVEKQQREAIAKKRQDLEAELANIKKAEEEALKAIGDAGQEAMKKVGDPILQLPEKTISISDEMKKILEDIGVTGSGKEGLGKLMEFIQSIPDGARPNLEELNKLLTDAGLKAIGPDELGRIYTFLDGIDEKARRATDDINDHFGNIDIPTVDINYRYVPLNDAPTGGPPSEAPEPGDTHPSGPPTANPYSMGGLVEPHQPDPYSLGGLVEQTPELRQYVLGGSVEPIAPVYAAAGKFFAPKGTDTVPAMLTPGEFVLNTKAVERVGVDRLTQFNNNSLSSSSASDGLVQTFSTGGLVYYFANGGPIFNAGDNTDGSIYAAGGGSFGSPAGTITGTSILGVSVPGLLGGSEKSTKVEDEKIQYQEVLRTVLTETQHILRTIGDESAHTVGSIGKNIAQIPEGGGQFGEKVKTSLKTVGVFGVGPEALGKIPILFKTLGGEADDAVLEINHAFSRIMIPSFGGGGSFIAPGGGIAPGPSGGLPGGGSFPMPGGGGSHEGETREGSQIIRDGQVVGHYNDDNEPVYNDGSSGVGSFPGNNDNPDGFSTYRDGDWEVTSGGIAGITYRTNVKTGEVQVYNKTTQQWESRGILGDSPSGGDDNRVYALAEGGLVSNAHATHLEEGGPVSNALINAGGPTYFAEGGPAGNTLINNAPSLMGGPTYLGEGGTVSHALINKPTYLEEGGPVSYAQSLVGGPTYLEKGGTVSSALINVGGPTYLEEGGPAGDTLIHSAQSLVGGPTYLEEGGSVSHAHGGPTYLEAGGPVSHAQSLATSTHSLVSGPTYLEEGGPVSTHVDGSTYLEEGGPVNNTSVGGPTYLEKGGSISNVQSLANSTRSLVSGPTYLEEGGSVGDTSIRSSAQSLVGGPTYLEEGGPAGDTLIHSAQSHVGGPTYLEEGGTVSTRSLVGGPTYLEEGGSVSNALIGGPVAYVSGPTYFEKGGSVSNAQSLETSTYLEEGGSVSHALINGPTYLEEGGSVRDAQSLANSMRSAVGIPIYLERGGSVSSVHEDESIYLEKGGPVSNALTNNTHARIGGSTYLTEGGPVYAALGQFFEPQGTDTIPAMLSPGEFVINQQATSKIGTGVLDQINHGLLPSGLSIPGSGWSPDRVYTAVMVHDPVMGGMIDNGELQRRYAQDSRYKNAEGGGFPSMSGDSVSLPLSPQVSSPHSSSPHSEAPHASSQTGAHQVGAMHAGSVIILPVISRPGHEAEDADRMIAALVKAAPSIRQNKARVRTALVEALGVK